MTLEETPDREPSNEPLVEMKPGLAPLDFYESNELEPENKLDLYDYVHWKRPQKLGLFYDKVLQSFTFKIVFTRVALYPFFGVYLNVPGHMYSALTSIFPMFWSLKFFWGFISDSKPIWGKSRIYYMALGQRFSITPHPQLNFL